MFAFLISVYCFGGNVTMFIYNIAYCMVQMGKISSGSCHGDPRLALFVFFALFVFDCFCKGDTCSCVADLFRFFIRCSLSLICFGETLSSVSNVPLKNLYVPLIFSNMLNGMLKTKAKKKVLWHNMKTCQKKRVLPAFQSYLAKAWS